MDTNDTPVDVTDLIKRHRANRAYREEMSHATPERTCAYERKFTYDSGPVIGAIFCPDCKSWLNKDGSVFMSAKTERTCEARDETKDCKGCRFDNMEHDPKPCHKCARAHPVNYSDYVDFYETRPAAQDADELKPCPHCGSTIAPTVMSNYDIDEYEQEDIDADPHGPSYAVLCSAYKDGCGANGGYAPDKSGATTRWNRRPSRPMSAEVEKAIETVQHLFSLADEDIYREQVNAWSVIVAALKEKV